VTRSWQRRRTRGVKEGRKEGRKEGVSCPFVKILRPSPGMLGNKTNKFESVVPIDFNYKVVYPQL